MPEIVIASAVIVVVVLAALRMTAGRRAAVVFADAREERLSHQLAEAVGCSLQDAQSAVRREVRIAPDQTDENILKRARYHYQRESPEKTCTVYRDRVRG